MKKIIRRKSLLVILMALFLAMTCFSTFAWLVKSKEINSRINFTTAAFDMDVTNDKISSTSLKLEEPGDSETVNVTVRNISLSSYNYVLLSTLTKNNVGGRDIGQVIDTYIEKDGKYVYIGNINKIFGTYNPTYLQTVLHSSVYNHLVAESSPHLSENKVDLSDNIKENNLLGGHKSTVPSGTVDPMDDYYTYRFKFVYNKGANPLLYKGSTFNITISALAEQIPDQLKRTTPVVVDTFERFKYVAELGNTSTIILSNNIQLQSNLIITNPINVNLNGYNIDLNGFSLNFEYNMDAANTNIYKLYDSGKRETHSRIVSSATGGRLTLSTTNTFLSVNGIDIEDSNPANLQVSVTHYDLNFIQKYLLEHYNKILDEPEINTDIDMVGQLSYYPVTVAVNASSPSITYVGGNLRVAAVNDDLNVPVQITVTDTSSSTNFVVHSVLKKHNTMDILTNIKEIIKQYSGLDSTTTTAIDGDIFLPITEDKFNSRITWNTSNAKVITVDGKTHLESESNDIVLTAVVNYNGAQYIIKYNVLTVNEVIKSKIEEFREYLISHMNNILYSDPTLKSVYYDGHVTEVQLPTSVSSLGISNVTYTIDTSPYLTLATDKLTLVDRPLTVSKEIVKLHYTVEYTDGQIISGTEFNTLDNNVLGYSEVEKYENPFSPIIPLIPNQSTLRTIDFPAVNGNYDLTYTVAANSTDVLSFTPVTVDGKSYYRAIYNKMNIPKEGRRVTFVATATRAGKSETLQFSYDLTGILHQGVDIEDISLFSYLLHNYDTFDDDYFSVDEARAITNLSAIDKGISSIKGLEHLINLRTIDLSRNNIKSIEPLKGLVKLTVLTLYDNNIVDITPLSDLVNITNLNLNNNRISNIKPISHLFELQELRLVRNKFINDFSPINNFKKIRILTAWDNAGITSDKYQKHNLYYFIKAHRQIQDMYGFGGYNGVYVTTSYNPPRNYGGNRLVVDSNERTGNLILSNIYPIHKVYNTISLPFEHNHDGTNYDIKWTRFDSASNIITIDNNNDVVTELHAPVTQAKITLIASINVNGKTTSRYFYIDVASLNNVLSIYADPTTATGYTPEGGFYKKAGSDILYRLDSDGYYAIIDDQSMPNLQLRYAVFSKFDLNSDGKITHDEMTDSSILTAQQTVPLDFSNADIDSIKGLGLLSDGIISLDLRGNFFEKIDDIKDLEKLSILYLDGEALKNGAQVFETMSQIDSLYLVGSNGVDKKEVLSSLLKLFISDLPNTKKIYLENYVKPWDPFLELSILAHSLIPTALNLRVGETIRIVKKLKYEYLGIEFDIDFNHETIYRYGRNGMNGGRYITRTEVVDSGTEYFEYTLVSSPPFDQTAQFNIGSIILKDGVELSTRLWWYHEISLFMDQELYVEYQPGVYGKYIDVFPWPVIRDVLTFWVNYPGPHHYIEKRDIMVNGVQVNKDVITYAALERVTTIDNRNYSYETPKAFWYTNNPQPDGDFLTGIEYFPNLTTLRLANLYNLQSLSKATHLTRLDLTGCFLDFTQIPNFSDLTLNVFQITNSYIIAYKGPLGEDLIVKPNSPLAHSLTNLYIGENHGTLAASDFPGMYRIDDLSFIGNIDNLQTLRLRSIDNNKSNVLERVGNYNALKTAYQKREAAFPGDTIDYRYYDVVVSEWKVWKPTKLDEHFDLLKTDILDVRVNNLRYEPSERIIDTANASETLFLPNKIILFTNSLGELKEYDISWSASFAGLPAITTGSFGEGYYLNQGNVYSSFTHDALIMYTANITSDGVTKTFRYYIMINKHSGDTAAGNTFMRFPDKYLREVIFRNRELHQGHYITSEGMLTDSAGTSFRRIYMHHCYYTNTNFYSRVRSLEGMQFFHRLDTISASHMHYVEDIGALKTLPYLGYADFNRSSISSLIDKEGDFVFEAAKNNRFSLYIQYNNIEDWSGLENFTNLVVLSERNISYSDTTQDFIAHYLPAIQSSPDARYLYSNLITLTNINGINFFKEVAPVIRDFKLTRNDNTFENGTPVNVLNKNMFTGPIMSGSNVTITQSVGVNDSPQNFTVDNSTLKITTNAKIPGTVINVSFRFTFQFPDRSYRWDMRIPVTYQPDPATVQYDYKIRLHNGTDVPVANVFDEVEFADILFTLYPGHVRTVGNSKVLLSDNITRMTLTNGRYKFRSLKGLEQFRNLDYLSLTNGKMTTLPNDLTVRTLILQQYQSWTYPFQGYNVYKDFSALKTYSNLIQLSLTGMFLSKEEIYDDIMPIVPQLTYISFDRNAISDYSFLLYDKNGQRHHDFDNTRVRIRHYWNHSTYEEDDLDVYLTNFVLQQAHSSWSDWPFSFISAGGKPYDRWQKTRKLTLDYVPKLVLNTAVDLPTYFTYKGYRYNLSYTCSDPALCSISGTQATLLADVDSVDLSVRFESYVDLQGVTHPLTTTTTVAVQQAKEINPVPGPKLIENCYIEESENDPDPTKATTYMNDPRLIMFTFFEPFRTYRNDVKYENGKYILRYSSRYTTNINCHYLYTYHNSYQISSMKGIADFTGFFEVFPELAYMRTRDHPIVYAKNFDEFANSKIVDLDIWRNYGVNYPQDQLNLQGFAGSDLRRLSIRTGSSSMSKTDLSFMRTLSKLYGFGYDYNNQYFRSEATYQSLPTRYVMSYLQVFGIIPVDTFKTIKLTKYDRNAVYVLESMDLTSLPITDGWKITPTTHTLSFPSTFTYRDEVYNIEWGSTSSNMTFTGSDLSIQSRSGLDRGQIVARVKIGDFYFERPFTVYYPA